MSCKNNQDFQFKKIHWLASMVSVCVILNMSVNTQYGTSALMYAAHYGKTEVVVELVKAGANLDLQNTVCQYRSACT